MRAKKIARPKDLSNQNIDEDIKQIINESYLMIESNKSKNREGELKNSFNEYSGSN